MKTYYEKELTEYVKVCENKGIPVKLSYVRYLKQRIEREKVEQESFVNKLFKGK